MAQTYPPSAAGIAANTVTPAAAATPVAAPPVAAPPVAATPVAANPLATATAAQTAYPPGIASNTPFALRFTPEEFMGMWNTLDEASNEYGSGVNSPEQGFASQLVQTLVYDPFYKDKMTYGTLRDGTAPIIKELGIDGAMSDVQIIQVFAKDDKGNPIDANPSGIEGFKRDITGGTLSAAGFFGGVRAGNLSVSAFPPLGWGAALRVGVPLLAGVTGAITGKAAGDEITEAFMGPEGLIIPGAPAYEAGRTAANMLPYIITPWMVPAAGANMGGRVVLNNLKDFIGPMVNRGQENFRRRALESMAASGNTNPLSARAVRGIEGLTERIGTSARQNPITTAMVEVGGLGGTTYGSYKAEDSFRDNGWMKFGMEVGFGLGGSLTTNLAVNTIPAIAVKGIYGPLKRLYQRLSGDTAATIEAQYNLTEGDMISSGNFILDQLEKNRESPDEILKSLNDASFNRFLVDEDGNQIELDAATRSASVTLLALQHQFMDAGPEAAASGAKKSMTDAVSALRRALLAMYADGSQEALGDAALIQTGLFEGALDSQLASAVSRMQKSMRQVRPEGENIDLEAANDIFTLLQRQYGSGRKEEELLWKRIPKNIELTEFVDEQGATTNVPNFITKWQELVGDYPIEIQDEILGNANLRFINKYVIRTSEELGLTPPAETAPTVLPALPEQKEVNKYLTKVSGTDNDGFLDELLDQFAEDGLNTSQIVQRLKERAKDALEPEPNWQDSMSSRPSGKLTVTQESKDLSSLLKAHANLISAQDIQAKAFQAVPPVEFVAGAVNASELQRIRSRLLNSSKKFASADDADESRIASQMANAILADLDSPQFGAFNKAYDTARNYSRAFNNVFTRAYAGDVLGTKGNGALKIPIEVLANNLMQGKEAFSRAKMLDGIAQFQVTQSLTNLLEAPLKEATGDISGLSAATRETGAALLEDFNKNIDPTTGVLDMALMRSWYGRNEDAIASVPNLKERIQDAMDGALQMRSSQDTLLRTMKADMLDPDGTLNVGKLSTWKNNENNKRLLDLFPALKSDLDDVKKAKTLLESTRVATKTELAQLKGVKGLYEVLPNKTANPATAITKALDSDTPFDTLTKYTNMIDNIGEDGFTVTTPLSPNQFDMYTKADIQLGLRTAIYDSIFEVQANGAAFRPDVAYNKLFIKHPNGKGQTVANFMLKHDLITEDQLKDTKKFLQEMGKIQAFTTNAKAGQTDAFFEDIGEGVKIIAAMGGSIAGTNIRQMLGGGGSGDLIAAGRGAAFGQGLAQKYMAELPQSLQASRVAIILSNDVLLKKVLQTGKTQRGKEALAAEVIDAFLRNYILNPIRRTGTEGVVSGSAPDDSVEAEVPTADPQSAVPVRLPPVERMQLPSQQMQQAPRPVAPQPLQPAPQVAASGPVDRQRFAALFPEDRDLMSGIGSLGGMA